MKPRCKVGELVVVIKGKNRDKFGKVVSAGNGEPFHAGGVCDWVVESKSLLSTKVGLRKSAYFPDEYLRPIRNPGEDATDEMVALLGKPASQPSKEHA